MAIRPRDSTLPALAALVVANLLPLWGVVAGGWTVRQVLVVYWLESGVVGLFSIPRILLAAGSDEVSTVSLTINGRPIDTSGPPEAVDGLHVYRSNVPLALFFCLHYGIFWVVHGAFVLAFPTIVPGAVGGDPTATLWTVGIAVVGLVFSHGVSFVTNYLRREEYRHTSAGERMQAPYGRVVVLHLTVLFDAGAHLREHRAASSRSADALSGTP